MLSERGRRHTEEFWKLLLYSLGVIGAAAGVSSSAAQHIPCPIHFVLRCSLWLEPLAKGKPKASQVQAPAMWSAPLAEGCVQGGLWRNITLFGRVFQHDGKRQWLHVALEESWT